MRMIGKIADERQARGFGDHLLTMGIANEVEDAGGGWAVWVHDDDQLERAGAELATFQASPDDPRYTDAALEAGRIRAQQQRRRERLVRNYHDVRTRWGQPRQWNIPVTLGLIFISVLAAIFTSLGSPKEGSPAQAVVHGLKMSNFLTFYRIPERVTAEQVTTEVLPEVRHGEVWRLITPIFLHFGIFHLIFNMLWMRDLGGMVERQKGTWMLLAIVLISGAVSNLAQYFMPSFSAMRAGVAAGNFGGMSGVVYALFGYVWVKGKWRPQEGLRANETTVVIMFGWLLITLLLPMSGIANTAHLAGLGTGAALGALPGRRTG